MTWEKPWRIPLWLAGAMLCACVDRSPRPCERLQHHTTTGHVVLCDCSCSDDPRFACPANVCEHADLEDDDWRWPEESSSSDAD
jgi:hypothetical protein